MKSQNGKTFLATAFAAMFAATAGAEQPTYVNGARVEGAEPGEWTHDWDAATAAAKKDGKPVFVNFTGSDWCGWCQLLKRKVFSQPEWGAWASNHVYLVHVDFPNDKELVPEKYRERNREIASHYGVRGYPTCYLVDSATLEPFARFGASKDVTAPAFLAKVSAAMPGAEPAADDGTTGTPGKTPLDRLPSRDRIAWFDFSEGTADKIRPDRSFQLRNVVAEDGVLSFNGIYVHSLAGRTNGCNAELRVPELDRDGFSVGLSFRPERVAGDDMPLLNFGNANRWFYAHLESDGRLRFGLNCHDVRLPTEGLAANRKWNWFVCSLDVPSKTLRCVLNGVRLKDVPLPADFAWKTSPDEFRTRGLGTVDTTYWNGGEAFKGDIGSFVLFGRPLGDDELASLCVVPAVRDSETSDSAKPVPPATGAAKPVACVNGARVDGAEPGEWTHDWEAATAAAKKDGKPVFVNFTGSDWCPWCMVLERKVFSQAEWGEWAGNHVYLVRVDFPKDKARVPEKYRGRNREISRKYNVGGFPTCFLLDSATLDPIGRFGASRDVTAEGFIAKVSAAMPRAGKAEPSGPKRPERPAPVPRAGGPVFEIENGVLRGVKSGDAEEIVVPDGVKTVCLDGLVRGRMKTLTIPEGVETLSRRSGGYVPGAPFETVRIPASVRSIERGAFDGNWRRLRTIEVAAGSPYAMRDGCLVDTRDDSLVFALPGRERIVVPDGVKTVGDWSVAANDAREIVVPEGVAAIGRGAFKDCRSLEILSLPASVEEIAKDAFSNCGRLARIDVSPDNPRYAARDGFLLDRRTGTLLRAFGPLVRVEVPGDVRTIGDHSFSFLDTLVSVTVPDSVRRIENGAFAYCKNLEELRLPERLDFCDDHFIMGCSGLREVRLPAGLASVWGNYSFGGCSSLRELVFPEGLRTIGCNGLGAVLRCDALERIFIPASVSSIGGGAFTENPRLRTIDVHPDNPSFRSEGGVLFSKDMTRLVRCPETKKGVYEIPGTVRKIDACAFFRCRGLSEIRIPESVAEIGWRAFEDCPAKTNRFAAASVAEESVQKAD